MNTSIDSGFSHSNLHWVRVFYSYKPPWFSIKTSVAGVFKGFCFSGDERWKHLRVELLDIERLEKLSGSRGKGMAVEDGMSTKNMMVGLSVLSRILRSFLMDFSHLFSGHVWMCSFLVFPMLCVFFLVIPCCFSWMFMCSWWVFDRSSYLLKLIAVPTFWSLTCSYFLEVNIELAETMFARDWSPNETNAGCPTASCDTSSPTCGLGPSIAPWSVESTLRLVGWWGLIGGDKW